MKAIVDNQDSLLKVLAEEITSSDDRHFSVYGDVNDTVKEYHLTYAEIRSLSVIPVGDNYPADFASDKYQYSSGSIIANPAYVDPATRF